ncbi:hypothetical protein P8452_48840 [Trifolium repens]|nr:hypothetical protein P8452_48840 [Trifolium repens]
MKVLVDNKSAIDLANNPELSNHHRRSPSISVAEIIFTATDCFIWRKHHHRNHNHWWMITQSELRTQNLELSHHILLGDY